VSLGRVLSAALDGVLVWSFMARRLLSAERRLADFVRVAVGERRSPGGE
jgi:hypothetical protein